MNTPDNDTSTTVHRLQHTQKTALKVEVFSGLRAVDPFFNV